jgi:DNA-binding CsgD family transcriptional regulator
MNLQARCELEIKRTGRAPRSGHRTLYAGSKAVMLRAWGSLPGPPPAQAPPGLTKLSARERELVTLVASGRTDTQIAQQMYISVRTVRSHLDRMRDKTGCRRRADLTRLALQAHLV